MDDRESGGLVQNADEGRSKRTVAVSHIIGIAGL